MTDEPRRYLGELIEKSGETFAELSRLIGRRDDYLRRHVRLGSPARLPGSESDILARYLGVQERWLRYDA